MTEIDYFDTDEAVTDPVITPFMQAKRSAGFEPKMVNGCVEISGCPVCRKSYRFTFVKDGATTKQCACCEAITK